MTGVETGDCLEREFKLKSVSHASIYTFKELLHFPLDALSVTPASFLKH